MSRDAAPMTARNFVQPSTRKIVKRSKEIAESQVNLGLSDSKSNHDKNRDNPSKNNSRYTKEYKQFEDEQEISIDTSTEQRSYKNYTIGPSHTTAVKHAVANLDDNSNDYSEDMDESVAFSKGLSDKENIEIQKKLQSKTSKYVSNKRPKKAIKSSRADTSLNFTTKPRRPKGFQVNHPDKLSLIHI